MDLKIQRPSPTCKETGSEFKAGDVMFSALVREEGRLIRHDWSHDAWAGAPDETLAWWRSVVPEQEDGGVSLAPVEALLDTLESLADQPEEASLRYLLALQLIRRRVLRFAESSSQEETETSDICDREDEVVSLVCRRRDCEYEVVAVMPKAEEHAALEERLASLLWSGGES
ncbi:MAG: hypothetical protein ISR34_07630 [Pirellulales bacterium]|nr:hypothetical protein [Pirellulales bacterium]